VAANVARWQKTPQDVPVRTLLELALVESDNTASDKLIDLLGGPIGATRQLQARGIDGIQLQASLHDRSFVSRNRGSAQALVRLLARLGRGELVTGTERDLLLGCMTRTRTGAHRLRARLPAGTVVADKSGTGRDGAATNDVGLITLPGDRGQLAVAVLLAGSSMTQEQQEDLIAEIGRTAYDAFAGTP
jgi:beta-lactamase class A